MKALVQQVIAILDTLLKRVRLCPTREIEFCQSEGGKI
jgi:hypothetical protein